MKTKIHVVADIEISFLVSFNVSGRLYRPLDCVLCATAAKERQSYLGDVRKAYGASGGVALHTS